nr:putative ribonuclease H-like domain-containing protein [Tanacetum cinerariifolium]
FYVGSKVPTAKPVVTADKGNKGKAVQASAHFKLVDDKHVLLRTPRQPNMYTIDLKNVVPHKKFNLLIAKALVDESMLWHKRLGHLNFKTMNKLVRSNLVKGLPSKSFENDHSYVAYLKGKQHKASCTKEDVHQGVKEKESRLGFIALLNWFHEAQMATSNEAAKKDDAIPDNNSPQKEQQEYCLFSCFLSQEEPKKIVDALKDPSWVEAMQQELLQFNIQNVWVLVDCPSGVRPIGTKWVLKNKKDERGIFIRNKPRLMAQGHTHEEEIDYEEVFTPVARNEAIRLFLAY